MLRYLLFCGVSAAVGSYAAVAAASKLEGKGALRPANATSHWMHGPEAGRRDDADLSHTLVGGITHVASAFFWALPFAVRLAHRPPREARTLFRDAALLSAFAAAFDYLVVPKRLTPGWEHALSQKSVGAGFVGLGLGLASGGLLAELDRTPAGTQRFLTKAKRFSRRMSRTIGLPRASMLSDVMHLPDRFHLPERARLPRAMRS